MEFGKGSLQKLFEMKRCVAKQNRGLNCRFFKKSTFILDCMRTSRIFLAFALVIGPLQTSCSTPRVGPYTQQEIQDNIYFHYFRKLSDAKLQKKIATSSYTLMRSTFAEFKLDLQRISASNRFLEALPQGLTHGDFHPLQMAWRNGDPVLDDWDTVQKGPLWIDVVRFEVAARLLAGEEGLRGYPESSCLESYSARLVSGKRSGAARALRPLAKQEELFQDFSQHPIWAKAENESKIPKDLLADFRSWIDAGPDLPIKSTDPMKRLVSGVGSYLKEKILILDAQKKLWELKEVDAGPGDCSSYESLSKLEKKLGPQALQEAVRACWTWKGRNFTLLQWDIRYWSPATKDFKSAVQLADHVRWMCERIAEFHEGSLSESEIRDWRMALKSPAPLRQRLREISDAAFTTYQSGYRMIMLEQE